MDLTTPEKDDDFNVRQKLIVETSVATAADRGLNLTMNIDAQSREQRQTPAPTTYPHCTVDTSVARRLSIHFRRHGTSDRGKPPGVHGIETRWTVATHQPGDTSDLVNVDFDSISPFIMDFDEDKRGQIVWFCSRWKNSNGLTGPWCEIMNAVIP